MKNKKNRAISKFRGFFLNILTFLSTPEIRQRTEFVKSQGRDAAALIVDLTRVGILGDGWSGGVAGGWKNVYFCVPNGVKNIEKKQ